MCWTTFEFPIKLKAEKDIPVFKIVRPTLESYYQHFNYELGKTYHIDDFGVDCGVTYTNIHSGLHSYSLHCHVVNRYVDVKITSPVYNKLLAIYFKDVYLLYCTIPEGSFYYVNEFGEYVSDTIVIKEIGRRYIVDKSNLVMI